jgi:hypothetical protein
LFDNAVKTARILNRAKYAYNVKLEKVLKGLLWENHFSGIYVNRQFH